MKVRHTIGLQHSQECALEEEWTLFQRSFRNMQPNEERCAHCREFISEKCKIKASKMTPKRGRKRQEIQESQGEREKT
jgi:hypothetical protein